MSGVNVDDMANCPLAAVCESCGSVEDLDMATLETPVGVYCATFCGGCTDAGRFPTMGYPTAMDRVLRHCEHLGIDADDMAAAIGSAG